MLTLPRYRLPWPLGALLCPVAAGYGWIVERRRPAPAPWRCPDCGETDWRRCKAAVLAAEDVRAARGGN